MALLEVRNLSISFGGLRAVISLMRELLCWMGRILQA